MRTLFILIFALISVQTTGWTKANEVVVTTDKDKKIWGEQPKDSLLKPLLNKYVVNEIIELRPIEGHHFNLKANNNCDLQAPSKMASNIMQCQFDEHGMKKINAYICDEKETFCKFEKLNILVTAPRGYKKAAKKRVSSNILYVPKASKKSPPGFIKNKSSFAIAEAKKKDQPLLIVFAAQWCPACNMLDENVFAETSFQTLTKDMVKLVVDVDSDLSWDLKEKFNVGSYPTTVMTNSTLSEIGRFVGYRSPAAVQKWVKEQVANKSNPIEQIVAKSQNNAATENEVLRLAQWQLDRGEPASAKITLLKVKSPAAEKLVHMADYQVYQAENNSVEGAKVLTTLIEKFPNDILVSQWANALASMDMAGAKKLTKTIVKNVETWTDGKTIDRTEFTPAELFYNLGEYYDSIEEKTLARQSFSKCAESYKALKGKSNLSTPRGAQMEQAFCLVKAGMNPEALKIFKSLVSVYKTEFAFNYYYARALYDTGELDEAYKYANSAFSGSYGDNMIRAAILKAQIEIDKKNLKGAEKTLTQTLDKIYLPSTTQIRSHRYVSNLKNVLAKVQLQKEALEIQRTEEKKQ